MTPEMRRIVILGGGFGGVYAALALEKYFLHDDNVEIVLISDENFLLFTPMLPEVASGSIEAKHIVSPLRAFFRKVQVHNSGVQRIDLDQRRVFTRHCQACRQYELRFDHLVLALGSTTHFHGLPGVAEHALPMKTLSDAMVLRNRVIDRFEHANMESDADVRKTLLTFVVAGGGFAGTETVAELRDFAHTARAYYPNIHPHAVNVVLVHQGTRIMPEISTDLAEYALRRLRQKGVDVRLQTGVRSATADCVELTTDEKIRARTLVWSAGTAPSPLLAGLPCLRNTRGQVIVNEFLEVPGHPGVWALGDCAEVPNPQSGRPHPPTAQHAVRQGKIVARNIRASLGGGKKMAFAFAPIGVLASLGRRSAVAEICGFKFSGFFAWWLWRTIYLFKLPGLERKVRVAGDWTLLNLAAEHSVADADGLLIPLRLTQGDLANMAGLARETVNVVLGRLRARGLVEMTRDNIRLRQPAALRLVHSMRSPIRPEVHHDHDFHVHPFGGAAALGADARRVDRDARHAFDAGAGRAALGARSPRV